VPPISETTTDAEVNGTRARGRASAVVLEARATARSVCDAYALTLLPELRASARLDRVPPVATGPPRSALISAVAALATTTSAGALALELAVTFADTANVEALNAAVTDTIRAAHLGVQALRVREEVAPRVQLAHATAYASHQIAEVLILRGGRAEPYATPEPPGRRRHQPVPKVWIALVDGLGKRLAHSEIVGPARAACGAAHDGAVHVLRAYGDVHPHGGTDAALWRFARMSALASAYAGWSLAGTS